MRDSPALDIVPLLLSRGANIKVYDPVAMPQAKSLLGDKVVFSKGPETCIKGADVCVIATEWNEFRAISALKFLELMAGNVIVDLRNVYSPKDMRAAGLNYNSIGRV